MPNPLLGVCKLLCLPDTSAPLICPFFAPSPFPIPKSSWKAAHRRSSPKNPTATCRPYAAGGFSKDGEGCGAWAGGHGVDAKASTPRGPIQSKPQGSCRAGRGLRRSWRAEQGDHPVHRKKHLCKLHHKKPCTNSTLASGLGEMKADNKDPGQSQRLEERSPAQ